eukprot:1008145-Rhodomonas_salina.2
MHHCAKCSTDTSAALMCDTGLGHAAPLCNLRAQSFQRLHHWSAPLTDIACGAIGLCKCYAMSGNDLAYRPTRVLRDVRH